MDGREDEAGGLSAAVSESILDGDRHQDLCAEMARIRSRLVTGGATYAETQRYRDLVTAWSLRRSSCTQPSITPELAAAVAEYRRAVDRLEQERLRKAVDEAFGGATSPT